jgi:competence protein ComEA
MLGRPKISRAASAALAQQRLDALESTFADRGPADPRAVDNPDDDRLDRADGSDAEVDGLDTDRGPRSRGRHVAAVIPPTRALALTAQQVTLVALAVAAVIAVAAWWVLRSAPQTEPVQLAEQRLLPSTAPAPTSARDPLSPTGASATAMTAQPPIVVDVAGKVRRPGIVELQAGSRVVDALRAAGGVRKGVDTSSLNLARLLVDGEQIVVGLEVPAAPTMPTSPSTSGSSGTITPVNLNTATLEQLDTLPGIGPVTAQAILDWRADNGAFTSVDELLEVSGIGDATLADIEAYVYV